MLKVLALAISLTASPFHVEAGAMVDQCDSYDVIVQYLWEKFGEYSDSYGAIDNGYGHAELFTNRDQTSWTFVVIRAEDGLTCFAASGKYWTKTEQVPQ